MGIRDFLARTITGNIKVYTIDDFRMDKPEVMRLNSRVRTEKINPEIDIAVTRAPNFTRKIKCSAENVKISGLKVKTRNYRIKRYVKQDVKVHKFSIKKKIQTYSPLKQVQALPQERKNLLKYIKNRPKTAANEMILAWYGPIVEGAVIKLALNKQRGTLLVWYNPGSRKLKARNVYLIRRLGLGEKPEWRWV
ncbi:MAG: hypothetical protein IJU48_03855 [Synergistaceae bacterium]|nr:hypothetical protein [Synergistaceae bacterium]